MILVSVALAVPTELSHQGRLLDASGLPLTGAHNVTFRIYDGVSVAWTEQQPLSFDGGYFSAQLGADGTNPLDDALFDGTLEITVAVDGGPETNRQPITSVPFARRAGVAAQLEGATLSELSCAAGDVALFDGADWSCTAAAAYTDADAIAAVGPHYTDADAITAVGPHFSAADAIAAVGPHYTDADAIVAVGPHYTDADAIVAVGPHYTDVDAVAAVGPHYTDVDAVAAVGPHYTDVDAVAAVGPHYTDADALAAVGPHLGARMIHSTDPNGGCPAGRPANQPLWTETITLAEDAFVYVRGDIIRLASGRHDLWLVVDGGLVDQTLTYTSANAWEDAHVTWSGLLTAGNHDIWMQSPSAGVWGCTSGWGSMDVLIFE